MSQIASAYIASSSLVAELDKLAVRKNTAEFMKVLHNDAREVVPAFAYSGAVVADAICYLEEHGVGLLSKFSVEMPKSRLDNLDVWEGLLACVNSADAAALLDDLESVTPLDDELRLFYESFTEEEWSEAGAAMQEALTFLKRGISLAAEQGKWLLVLVG